MAIQEIGAAPASPHPTASEQTGAFSRMIERGGWVMPLLLGIVLRLAFIWANEMDGGDWVSRTVHARNFVRGIAPIWARTPWPEGNYLLPAIPMWLGGDAYWSVRVFCALFSSLAIPLAFVVGQQFGGRRGGLLAAWTLAILPFHVYVSGNGAMTEGPFLVFVLGSIASAVRWAETPSRGGWLIASALCVVGAEAFRFDGVFVGASIGFVALFVKDERGWVIRRPRVLAAIAAFAVISLAYPIALVISWKALWGDPLYMVKYAEENTAQFFDSGGHQRWSKWLYTAYSVGFWPFIGPVFALTPLIWVASWYGVWRSRGRVATWFLVLPLVVLTLFYIRSALAHMLLNQIRYVTVLSVPLLACFWVSVANLAPRMRRLAIGAALVSMAAIQVVPIDAAWHDRGVVSRQLAVYAVVRPKQHVARDVVQWINQHASPEQKVVFTPHASSSWLALAKNGSIPHVRRLNIYRTSNLVYDSTGLAAAIRDSLQSADWVVASGGANTEGVRDALVKELVQPTRTGSDSTLQWDGVHMRLAADFGAMRVYKVARTTGISPEPTSNGGRQK
jgi:hypothetical protein